MTNGVAKLYDRLDAKERTSALLAAWVRGDAVESHRLNATAPRRTEQRWHHHDRVKAIWNIAAMVRIEMLGTLANLWHSQARLAWALDAAEADGDSADVVNDVRLWRAFVDVSCWRLSQHQAAWSIVCKTLDVPPDYLNEFGDCIALDITNDRLGENTPTVDAVRERFAELGQSVGELATAEGIAAGWLDLFAGLTGATER